MSLRLLTLSLLLAPVASASDEIILIRSGQVAGIPGFPGQLITDGTCLAGPAAAPLSGAGFSTEFADACAGTAPYVIQPLGVYLQDLACDPDARWIHPSINAAFEGKPAQSVLYCFPFEVQSPQVCAATLTFCWAADDRLGDLDGGPNLDGVYINGTRASILMRGGGYTTQSTRSITVTSLVHPGANQLQVYARDTQSVAGGLIFSARIKVSPPPPCEDSEVVETVVLRSGQVDGVPGVPGQVVSPDVFCLAGSGPDMPIQAAPFTPLDLESYCFDLPYVATAAPGWLQGLACDPDARWINRFLDGSLRGFPGLSSVYCISFWVDTTDICQASLDLCWAVDDQLGDPNPSGPNPEGVYLNGLPIDPPIWGGTPSFQLNATRDVSALITPGWNTLYLYQRDRQLNSPNFSGLIYSGALELKKQPACPPIHNGDDYCSANINSSGASAHLSAVGTILVDDQDFTLLAEGLPTNKFGYFLASQTQGFVPNPGGSQGNLCLGGNIARFIQQIGFSGSTGSFNAPIDLANIPLAGGTAVLPGDTWNFQAWYRDNNPGPTSNFTQGLSVTFE